MADPLSAAEANANAAMAAAESSSTPESDQAALDALAAQEAALKAKEDSLRASMQTAVGIRDAQKKKAKPLAMANVNEEAITQADPSNPGQKFFFGSVGVIKFTDKTSFHVSRTHMTVHNPTVIANLIDASKLPKNPNRIFLES